MSDAPLHRAYLALGSNIHPEQNLPAAVRELARYGEVLAVSKVWETAPVGFADQANFLNAAVLLATSLKALELRQDSIPAIERKLNRVRDPENVNAPRTIDIDVALFDRDILTVGHRQIPDPDLLTRAFVAVPLAEIDPAYLHPQVHRTLLEIAGDFVDADPPMVLRPDVDLASSIPSATIPPEREPVARGSKP